MVHNPLIQLIMEYYSLYDNQLNSVRSFALNLGDEDAVRAALVNFLLLGNFSEEGEESVQSNSLEELCNYYEFTLIKSGEPITENFELFN